MWIILFITVITMIAGMFAAGYAGLYEILVEYVLIMWVVAKIVLEVTDKIEKHTDRKNWLKISWKWFSTFKSRKIKQILDGRVLLPFLQVILLGQCIGWITAFFLLLFKDPSDVISREIRETIFDVLICTSLLTFLFVLLNGIYSASKEQDVDVDLDFRDPDIDIRDEIWKMQGSMIRSGLATARYMITSHIILFLGILSFGLGWFFRGQIPGTFLDFIANWQIAI